MSQGLADLLQAVAAADPTPLWAGLEAMGIIVTLGLLGLLSLAESALVSVGPAYLRRLAEQGDRRAVVVVGLVGQRERTLASLAAAEMLLLALLAALVTHLALVLGGLGTLAWASALALAAVLLLAQAVPKTYGVQHAERVALRLGRAVAVLGVLLAPVTTLARGGCRLLAGRAEPEAVTLGEGELRQLAAEEGELDEGEREMIHGVVDFADKVAREMMVPRTDMVALPSSAALPEAVAVVRQHGHSRVPVYTDSVDNIVGLLYARDLMAALLQGRREAPLASLLRPAYFVPEGKPVGDLLREMQRRQVHMAIVIDEYGGTAGLITIEDLLEEIFGEIQDEYDLAEEATIRRLDEQTALVDGRVAVDEVAQAFGVELPEGEFDSIGGLVLGELGRLPAQGEVLQVNGLELTVEKVSRQRVQQVRVARRRE